MTPWWMVVLLGMGIVFVGLSLMVLMCDGLRLLFAGKGEAAPQQAAAVSSPVEAEIPNRKRLLAAIAAAIAEEEGTDVSGIRILSFKRGTKA